MVPSSSHSLQSPLCYFFVNYWDVFWSPCLPCCSCSQCQAEHWLWTGTWSEITSAWLFSAAWHSHAILFWQGMEVSRSFQRGHLKEKKKVVTAKKILSCHFFDLLCWHNVWHSCSYLNPWKYKPGANRVWSRVGTWESNGTRNCSICPGRPSSLLLSRD